MKTALLTTVALAVLGSAAMAADLTPVVTKSPVMAAPASDWSGFYFGGHGGWGWSDTTAEDPFTATGVTFTPLFANPKASGWVAGGTEASCVQKAGDAARTPRE